MRVDKRSEGNGDPCHAFGGTGHHSGGGAFPCKGVVMRLRKFQVEFLKRALAPGIDIAALSLSRGQGKSFLAAHILTRCLTPGDALHQPGKEYVQCAGSIEQARMVYGFVRAALEPTGEYSWIDSTTRLGATHKPSNTKLRAISSNAKTSFGLVNVPLPVRVQEARARRA